MVTTVNDAQTMSNAQVDDLSKVKHRLAELEQFTEEAITVTVKLLGEGHGHVSVLQNAKSRIDEARVAIEAAEDSLDLVSSYFASLL